MQSDMPQTAGEMSRGQTQSTGQRSWNVVLDGEVIGSVHGNTEVQARDIIAGLRMPNISIRPAD